MQKLTPSPRLRDGVFAWNKGSSGQSPEVFYWAIFALVNRPQWDQRARPAQHHHAHSAGDHRPRALRGRLHAQLAERVGHGMLPGQRGRRHAEGQADAVRSTYIATFKQLTMSMVTIATMLGLAYLMNYSGMTSTLGLALATTGATFPFFSAVLGCRRSSTTARAASSASATRPPSRSSTSSASASRASSFGRTSSARPLELGHAPQSRRGARRPGPRPAVASSHRTLRQHLRPLALGDQDARAALPPSRSRHRHLHARADALARGGERRDGPSGRRPDPSLRAGRLRDRGRRRQAHAPRHRLPPRGRGALPRAAPRPHARARRAAHARRLRRPGAPAPRPRLRDPDQPAGRRGRSLNYAYNVPAEAG